MSHEQEWELLEDTLKRYLADLPQLERLSEGVKETAGPQQFENLDKVLDNPSSYRDALVIQLAFALRQPGLDTTKRPEGGRSVAIKLGHFLKASHIQSVADAFQNVGKNTANLTRGNYQEFDTFLTWAATASQDALVPCFEYACAKVAANARPVASMPEINVANLTFGACLGLYAEMLATPSEGAHEQFIVASLMDAWVQQTTPAYRVETKRLNASDQSSKVAGDIQVKEGSLVVEAYEVTANEWTTKTDRLDDKLKRYDLSRIHVTAPIGHSDIGAIAEDLREMPEDISVLDLNWLVAVELHFLRRTYRALALTRLYEYLDRYQPDTARVNAFVELLVRRNLADYPVNKGD